MKKLIYALLPLCMLFLSYTSHAFGHYEYCKATTQTTSDSWNVYVNRQWVGGGSPPPFMIQVEYRFTTLYRNGTSITTSWANLPSGGSYYIGTSGMGGQITTVEIRVPGLSMPGQPPAYTITVLSPC